MKGSLAPKSLEDDDSGRLTKYGTRCVIASKASLAHSGATFKLALEEERRGLPAPEQVAVLDGCEGARQGTFGRGENTNLPIVNDESGDVVYSCS